MILLLGSQKGGCGKSTLATNIAAALAHKSDVVLLDADTQGTSSTWAQDREDLDVPVVYSFQKFGDIDHAVKDLAGLYDHVVIDAIGRDSKELRSGLAVADVVLCPFRPSQADVDTAEHLAEVVNKVYSEFVRPGYASSLLPRSMYRKSTPGITWRPNLGGFPLTSEQC